MMSASDFDRRSRRLRLRFGAVADVYDRARPGYAPPRLDWVLPDRRAPPGARPGRRHRQADAACWSTAALEVVAIDPSEPMLAVLRANLPGVDARVGSAEATGLPDADVDAVVIGSALHWFDRPAADREIARVLRPGGVVGVFRNRRDHSVPGSPTSRLLDRRHAPTCSRQQRRCAATAGFDADRFGPAELAEFPFPQQLTPTGWPSCSRRARTSSTCTRPTAPGCWTRSAASRARTPTWPGGDASSCPTGRSSRRRSGAASSAEGMRR